MKKKITQTNIEEIKGTKEWLDKYFPIVHASSLSLDDEILKHEPETGSQKEFKEYLVKIIKSGWLPDFRAPIMDPSLDENGNICYKAGMMPAVGKSRSWWEEKAKEFLPEKSSWLGSAMERIIFLALLMKELIEKCDYTISDAWRAVCDKSQDLGHYCNTKNSIHDLETTGNRRVGKWYDLGNTRKIVAGGFFGGSYVDDNLSYPLTYTNCGKPYIEKEPAFGVGWIVLSLDLEREKRITKEWLDKYFPVVPASTLSLYDKILRHKPKTENQKDFKQRLVKAIKSGLQDFRAPIMDPSFDKNGKICYKAGKKPAIYKEPLWWEKTAKEFLPEKESRLGLTEERIAFLALLMKELIEKCNYTISDAWRAVCDNSKELGYYCDSKEPNWDDLEKKDDYEPTGSRMVGKWYDLGNTRKMVKDKDDNYLCMGGSRIDDSDICPLSQVEKEEGSKFHKISVALGWVVGWIVLSV